MYYHNFHTLFRRKNMSRSLLKLVVLAFVCLSHGIQAKSCKGWAKYTLTFQGEWSKATHPKDFPSGPHFSPVVGCSHKNSYVMWIPGKKASEGVQSVAETGAYVKLNNEMDTQIASKNAHKRYLGAPSIRPGTASRVINNIEVTSEYPLVSFITMIAPSPDWFAGVHDYDLCNRTSGEWLSSRARDLPPYDAGTDSGPAFSSADDPTSPHVNIHLLTNNTEGSFRGDKPVKRFGTFTFTKTSENTTAPTGPTGTANPCARFNVPLLLIFCFFNIICHIL